MLICSDVILNLLKRVSDGSFFFLNLGAQIRCLQNWYTEFKLALDQPLNVYNSKSSSILSHIMLNAVNFVDNDGGPCDAYSKSGFSRPDQHGTWYLPP